MSTNNIVVFRTRRPFWNLLIAAAAFCILPYCVMEIVKGFQERSSLNMAMVYIGFFAISIGAHYSTIHEFHFDLERKRYKVHAILLFVFKGNWKTPDTFDYISVFHKRYKHNEINLWYNENKRLNLGVYKNEEIALSKAKIIARKLQLDLLDAVTDPRDSKWVELD